MANRKRIIPIIAILVLAGLFWFGKQWWYGRAHESTDNAQVDGHLVPVLAKVGGFLFFSTGGRLRRGFMPAGGELIGLAMLTIVLNLFRTTSQPLAGLAQLALALCIASPLYWAGLCDAVNIAPGALSAPAAK